MKPLTIGFVAELAGVGVETIRFYERQALVARPSRPRSGYRVYPESVVGRILFIRHAQALGFTLDEISGLLALRLTPGNKCRAVRSRAALKLADVRERIASLSQIEGALEALVAACPGRGPVSACTILEALESPGLVVPPVMKWRRKSRGEGDMESLDVSIDGLQCNGCASTVQALLSHEQGVKSARVSFGERKASILYDPKQTDPVRLTAAIEKAGFRATAQRDPSS